jgi:hypothetical protein
MADLTSAATTFVESILEMPGKFADIAMHDPLSAILLASGALFVGIAVAAFGYLSLGAFFSLFTVETSTRPPRQGR